MQILDDSIMLCDLCSGVSDDAIHKAYKAKIEMTKLKRWIKGTVKLMTIRLTLEKEIEDLERMKFRESLNTQEDDLVSTMGQSHGGVDISAKICTPSRSKIKESYKKLEWDESQLPAETLSSDQKGILANLENDEEWSNDSASYSGDTNSETMSLEQKRILAFKGFYERPAVSPATENSRVRRSEVKRNIQSQLGHDDSYLHSVVSSDQIVRSSLRGMPPERDKMLVALKIETDMVKLVQGMGCSSKLGKFISFKNFFLFCFFASLSLSCLLILGIHSSLPLTRLNASLCGSSIMIPEIRSLSPSRSSILRNVNIGDSKSCTSLSSWVSMSTVTSWSPMSLTMSPAWE